MHVLGVLSGTACMRALMRFMRYLRTESSMCAVKRSLQYADSMRLKTETSTSGIVYDGGHLLDANAYP